MVNTPAIHNPKSGDRQCLTGVAADLLSPIVISDPASARIERKQPRTNVLRNWIEKRKAFARIRLNRICNDEASAPAGHFRMRRLILTYFPRRISAGTGQIASFFASMLSGAKKKAGACDESVVSADASCIIA